GKLDDSALAYETLTDKLKNMEPMLANLEFSLTGTKKRLKEEGKRRRTAEIAQVEAETRVQQARDESEAWREQCDALRAELEHKVRENDQLKRDQDTSRQQLKALGNQLGSSIQSRREDRGGDSPLPYVDSGIITEAVSNKSTSIATAASSDEAYAEVLDELETITEQLIATQQKLWRTEDQLRESEATAVSLEGDIRRLKNKQENGDTHQNTKRELAELRAELAVTTRQLEDGSRGGHSRGATVREQERELEEQDDRIEILKDQIEEMENNGKSTQQQIIELEELLEESQEENIRLVEEIASLRILLQDGVEIQDSQFRMKESISKEVRSQVLKEANERREKEINALREQFKVVFRENTALKERIERLQSGRPDLAGSGDSDLRRKVDTLNTELSKTRDEHKKLLVETEVAWKNKLDQAMTGDVIPEDLLEEMEEEMKTAIDSAAERVRLLQAEKEALQDNVEKLERELELNETKVYSSNERFQESENNLKASRDEILRLKKSNTHLTSELEYTTRIMSRMDSECERLTRQHSELKAELDVALQVIETNGMDTETVNTEETLKAREQVHRLTANLNKLKGDYSALLRELERTREHFLDSQEMMSKGNDVKMGELSEQVAQLEESLQRSSLEQKDMSKKLQETQQKYQEREMAVNMELELELEAAKKKISDMETETSGSSQSQKSLRKELKQCRDALSSSRIENQKLEEEIDNMKSTIHDISRSRSSVDPAPAADNLPFAASRDPPSVSYETYEDSAMTKDVVLENELLREKIIRMGSDKTSEEMKRVKGQLNAKTEQLRSLEQSFHESQSFLQDVEKKLCMTEQDLHQAEEESSDLKSEISALKESLRDAHRIHSETAHQLKSVKKQSRNFSREVEGDSLMAVDFDGATSNELKIELEKLTDEKSTLKHKLDDSKIALSVSEYSQERTKEELRISQSKLEKSQRNVKVLKEELTKLAHAFSELRNEHESLLGAYKSRSGHTPTKGPVGVKTEHRLQELEEKLSQSAVEIESKDAEIESLECNLLTSREETRLLSEEITNLSAAFESAKAEYDVVVDELDAVQALFEKTRQDAENTDKESVALKFHDRMAQQMESRKKQLTERLESAYAENLDVRKKPDDTEIPLSEALKSSKRSVQTEGLEKQGDVLQNALQDAQKESPSDNPVINEKTLSAVFKSEEMQDLKEQFNDLIQENINLEQVVRQSELALTLAKDVEEKNKEEASNLERELSSLKTSKAKLQQEVNNLTFEVERCSQDHNDVLREAKSTLRAETESRVKALQCQIEALTIENSTLQNCIETMPSQDVMSIKTNTEELRKLQSQLQTALQEKQEVVRELSAMQAQLYNAGSTAQKSRTSDIVRSYSVDSSKDLLADPEHHVAERDATLETLERINSLLSSVEFLERHHEITLRTSHSDLTLTSQKAEEIRRKVAFLTYAFQKEKKEHSDVLLRLTSARKAVISGEAGNGVKALEEQCHRLEEKLEISETALWTARDAEERLRNEIGLSEKKYEKCQEEASYFKVQVKRLQEMLQDTKNDHASMKEKLDQVNGQISNLIKTAEERGKAAAMEELQQREDTPPRSEESMLFYQGIAQENAELHSRLMETEAALAAARSMKSDYEQQLRQLNSDSGSFESNSDSLSSKIRDSNISKEEVPLALENEAKYSLLSSEFQKLNEQSDALAEQIKFAETAVTSVYDQHKNLKDDADARTAVTKALRDEVEEVVDVTNQRNQEMGEITILMENRVNNTEESVEKLEKELSSTRGSVELSRTDLLYSQHEETASRLSVLVSRMASKFGHRQAVSESPHSKIEQHASLNSKTPPQHEECDNVGDDHGDDDDDALAEKLLEETLQSGSDTEKASCNNSGRLSEDSALLLRTSRSVSPFTLSLLTDNEQTKQEEEIYNANNAAAAAAAAAAVTNEEPVVLHVYDAEVEAAGNGLQDTATTTTLERVVDEETTMETREDCDLETRE
ncbi:MAG: hypothetical protein SGILL_001891, partial [Bacillariaceae sp.]